MNPTLLITDDSMIVREMIKDLATELGWKVVGEAANGKEAIDRFRELRPDVTTLDLVMPQYDGLYALAGIRAIDAQARVLIVSAIDQAAVLKEAIRGGAADFIVKPFDKARAKKALLLLGSSTQNPVSNLEKAS